MNNFVKCHNEWKKEQFWPFIGCCIADSQTDTGRHQLYNNGSLVLFPLLDYHLILVIISNNASFRSFKDHGDGDVSHGLEGRAEVVQALPRVTLLHSR